MPHRALSSLTDLCLAYAGLNFHRIALGRYASMPTELKQRFMRAVCLRAKQLTAREFQFFLEPQMTSLDLAQCRNLNETHFDLIAKQLGHLTSLSLAGCVHVTPEVLQQLTEACPHIQRLTLSGCPKVTDVVVQMIAMRYHTNLARLELNECFEITDASLDQLSQLCTNIRALNIGYCQYVTDNGIDFLCRQSPTDQKTSCLRFEEIVLDYCTELTDTSIQRFVSFNSALRLLSMGGCKITDNAIRYVAGYCPRLVHLDVRECDQLTDYTITVIAQRCKSLEIFNGASGGRYTDISAQQLALYSHQLKNLNLSRSTSVTNASIRSIALGCTRIENLNLSCTQVSDEGLKQLVTSCRNLKQLDISFCKRVTLAGIKLVVFQCLSLRKLAIWGIIIPDEMMRNVTRPDLEIARTQHQAGALPTSL